MAESADAKDALNFKSDEDVQELFLKKIKELKIAIENDLEACDIRWTLFVAASQSYRFDSRLKPYPPNFSGAEINDIEKLDRIIDKTPAIKDILKLIIENNIEALKPDIVDLLHWAVIALKEPILKTVPKIDFEKVLSKIPSSKNVFPKPSHIFAVNPVTNSSSENKFKKHADEWTTNYAFHGSKLDSFHSILNHGLQQHLSKTAAFGDGIYLSSELQVSFQYSPAGVSWNKTVCGSDMMSCVALCEYVNHPKYLKCHIKDENNPAIKRIRNEDIPEKYFIISNNEIVRVRYLLIYGKDSSNYKTSISENTIWRWIANNKTMVSMCFYGLFLASLGLLNSRTGAYYRQLMTKKAWALLKFFKVKENEL